MSQINAPVGFWIRFITKILDLLWPIVISTAVLFALLEKTGNRYQFQGDYGYYVWTLISALLIFISFIVIPHFTKGRTLFMFLTRIKIVCKQPGQPFFSLLKREALFALTWILLLLLAMAVINHTLVNDFAKNNQTSISYSNFEKVRIGVVSTCGTIMIIAQMIAIVGIITRQDKKGLHDRISQTDTVWVNRFIAMAPEKVVKKIQPRPVNDELVEWIAK